MDGHDRTRTRSDRALGRRKVERVRRRIDVDEDRRGARHHDRRRGGDEREGRRDDLVAGADAERGQGQTQRVRARGDAQRPGDAADGGQLLLERPALGAQHELARVEHARGGGEQLGPEGRVLAGQIDERNHLNLGSELVAPPPTLVSTTFPSPRRLSEKRNSLSGFLPGRSGFRLMYSSVRAQQSNLRSTPNRFSTALVVRMSQFVLACATRLGQSSTEAAPWRKCVDWFDGRLLPGLKVPGVWTKYGTITGGVRVKRVPTLAVTRGTINVTSVVYAWSPSPTTL